MNEQQKDAVYAAYLGIRVLRTMCGRAGLRLGSETSAALLTTLNEAFPGLHDQVEAQQQRVEGSHEV
jgi:hypothetical protein